MTAEQKMKSNGSWANHYRPDSLNNVVLSNRLRTVFEGWTIGNATPPNLLFHGDYGTGKTTIAKIIARECSVMTSESNWQSIEFYYSCNSEGVTARLNKIRDKVSSMNIYDTDGTYRPIYVLDEFDKLSNRFQKQLIDVIELSSAKAGFIVVCNDLKKVIEPIQSRCSCIDFRYSLSNRKLYAEGLAAYGRSILKAEGINFNEADIQSLAIKNWNKPRSFVNELQLYSSSGTLTL